jgi:hypothetical protein
MPGPAKCRTDLVAFNLSPCCGFAVQRADTVRKQAIQLFTSPSRFYPYKYSEKVQAVNILAFA